MCGLRVTFIASMASLRETRQPHTPSMRYAGAALSLGAVAPYGRYADAKALGISDWGPKVPAQLAWCLQELPSLVVPLACLVRPGWGPASATNGVLLLGFLAHYANRALVYPLRIRGGAPTPAYVMASAALFTFTNGYLQAGALGGPWASAVPGDAAFGGGVLLFLAGALGNALPRRAPAVSTGAGGDGLQGTDRGALRVRVRKSNSRARDATHAWCVRLRRRDR